jgi:hypothetical protein
MIGARRHAGQTSMLLGDWRDLLCETFAFLCGLNPQAETAKRAKQDAKLRKGIQISALMAVPAFVL